MHSSVTLCLPRPVTEIKKGRPAMDGGQRVWAPHPTEGYQVGLIVDVGADTLSVEPLGKAGKVSCMWTKSMHSLILVLDVYIF